MTFTLIFLTNTLMWLREAMCAVWWEWIKINVNIKIAVACLSLFNNYVILRRKEVQFVLLL